jgi:NCS1 family nucleobase:cation symporter-1
LNIPALISWILVVAGALGLALTGTVHLFFVALPAWISSTLIYLLLAGWMGAREANDESESLGHKGQPIFPKMSPFTDSDRSAPLTGSSMIAGLIAIGALGVCLALPIWVFVMDNSGGPSQRSSYHAALATASVIHLVAAAIWVFKIDAAVPGEA